MADIPVEVIEHMEKEAAAPFGRRRRTAAPSDLAAWALRWRAAADYRAAGIGRTEASPAALPQRSPQFVSVRIGSSVVSDLS